MENGVGEHAKPPLLIAESSVHHAEARELLAARVAGDLLGELLGRERVAFGVRLAVGDLRLDEGEEHGRA